MSGLSRGCLEWRWNTVKRDKDEDGRKNGAKEGGIKGGKKMGEKVALRHLKRWERNGRTDNEKATRKIGRVN